VSQEPREPQEPQEPPGETKGSSLAERLEEGRKTFQPGLWLRLVVIGVVAVYALVFVVLNTRSVKVSFVFGSTRVSLIFTLLLALAAGLVLGVLASQLHRHRQRRR
jgi:uncharacterized integral membrane protein